MNKIYLVLLLTSFQSFSQNNDWIEYQLDSLVKFQLPAKSVNVFDSIVGVKIYELSARLNGVNYVGSKFKIEPSILPSNSNELNELYHIVIPGMVKSFPHTKETKFEITKSGYQGQKVILEDENNVPVHSLELFLLEDNLYIFYYVNDIKYEVVESDYFFQSVSLSESESIEQFRGDSTFIKMIKFFRIELLVILGIIVLITTIVAIILSRNKTA